jgi:hypothetical protein
VCQTAADQCLGDKDCPDAGGGFGNGVCGYSADAGARVCGEGPLACPGRPFLVEEIARVAPLARRDDWFAGGIAPDFSRLSLAERSALADHWARTAQMEHASVAAFARFALELLALGAPAWAIVETQSAMADETAHAQMAFALASAYAGRPVGPAPLAIDGALGAVTQRTVFATLVREGCIGETLAAILATDELEEIQDRAVRAVLERIAADETRHAVLAWRVARWLVARGDGDFRDWAAAEIARAVAERSDGSPIVSAALRDVIEPCAAAILDEVVVASRACGASNSARDRATSSGRSS